MKLGDLDVEGERTVSGALSWKFRNTTCTIEPRVHGILGGRVREHSIG